MPVVQAEVISRLKAGDTIVHVMPDDLGAPNSRCTDVAQL